MITDIFVSLFMIPIILFRGIKIIFIKTKNIKHVLIFSFIVYFVLSYTLFLWGPIKYPKINLTIMTVFIFLYLISLVLGYALSTKIRMSSTKKSNDFNSNIKIILTIGLIIALPLTLLTLVRYAGSSNPIVILQSVFNGVIDSKDAYLYNLDLEKNSGILTQISTLLSPLTFAVLPLGVYYFKNMNWSLRILFVIQIICDAFIFIAKGTNFGLFKIIISILVVLYIKTEETGKKSVFNSIISLSVIFVIFYFFMSISSRMEYNNIPLTILNIPVDSNHLIFRILPKGISLPLFLGVSYISQGYYGMSLAFNYPFTSTFGFGSGRFLINYGDKLLDSDLWSRTYQFKMDGLWSSRVSWHTAYTWFANDVSFFGVIFIIFIIGLMFGLILKEAKKNRDLLSIILLPLYIVLLIFIPSNNIIFDNPTMFVPFAILNVMWLARFIFRKA